MFSLVFRHVVMLASFGVIVGCADSKEVTTGSSPREIIERRIGRDVEPLQVSGGGVRVESIEFQSETVPFGEDGTDHAESALDQQKRSKELLFLALKYSLGDGVDQDYGKMRLCLEESYRLGLQYAGYWLGLYYVSDEYGEVDLEKGITYFRQVAHAVSEAAFSLSQLYADEQSKAYFAPIEAERWLYVAASSGHSRAMYQLAKTFEEKGDVEADVKRSVWLSLALYNRNNKIGGGLESLEVTIADIEESLLLSELEKQSEKMALRRELFSQLFRVIDANVRTRDLEWKLEG